MNFNKNSDETVPPATSRKYNRLSHPTIISILLFMTLFQIYGCGPLGITDPESDSPFGRNESQPKKNWEIKRTLISNEVNCIAADPENVWIATAKGVSRWHRSENQWFHYTMENGLANDMVNAVAIDGKWVWFATDEGVSRYDSDTNTWTTYRSIDGLASDEVSSVAVDGNYVWFGTSNGLNRYDKTIDSWAVRTRKDGLVSRIVTTIAVEPEYVWVGTDREINPDPHGWDEDPRFSKGGVSRYHRDTDSWNNYTKSDGLIDNEIATIAVDDDSVWFGTQHKGVSQYNQVDQTFVKTYTKTDLLKSNIISCIRSDGFQVWFGTANAGVHRYIKPVNTWVHYTKVDGLASNHVSWIMTQGTDVWFASKEDGISRFDKVTGEWTRYTQADFLADNDIRDITQDSSGKLWIATVSGLSIFSPQEQTWEVISKEDGLPTNYVMSVNVTVLPSTQSEKDFVDGHNRNSNNPAIWIGTAQGLGACSHPGGKWHIYRPTEGEAFVTAVAAAEIGQDAPANTRHLWLGTNLGPAMYDLDAKKWNQLKLPDDPKNPRITSVLVQNGHVWFAGVDGIWQYTVTDKHMQNMSKGLINRSINTILAIDNTLWVGTQAGLAKFDSSKQQWIPISFGDNAKAEGRSSSITALSSHEGVLWVGTPRGLGKWTVATEKWEPCKITYNIRDIVCDKGKKLWLATPIGLVEYNISDGKEVLHQSCPVRHPLVETQVSHIMFDEDYIWFSNWKFSRNGGILRYHRPTQTWQRFTRFDIFTIVWTVFVFFMDIKQESGYPFRKHKFERIFQMTPLSYLDNMLSDF